MQTNRSCGYSRNGFPFCHGTGILLRITFIAKILSRGNLLCRRSILAPPLLPLRSFVFADRYTVIEPWILIGILLGDGMDRLFRVTIIIFDSRNFFYSILFYLYVYLFVCLLLSILWSNRVSRERRCILRLRWQLIKLKIYARAININSFHYTFYLFVVFLLKNLHECERIDLCFLLFSFYLFIFASSRILRFNKI